MTDGNPSPAKGTELHIVFASDKGSTESMGCTKHTPSIPLSVDRETQNGGHAYAALLFKLRVSLTAVLVLVLIGQNAQRRQQHRCGHHLHIGLAQTLVVGLGKVEQLVPAIQTS